MHAAPHFQSSSVREGSIELLPGQYFDKQTNLHYNCFRDYDPAIGRYIQADPLGIAPGVGTIGVPDAGPKLPSRLQDPQDMQQALRLGLNQSYSYVDANPLNRIDPLGLFTVSVGGRGTFFFGGVGGTYGGSFGVSSSGQFCAQFQSCARGGAGASVGAVGTVSVGTGQFCAGNSLGGGIFASGGVGPFGSFSTNTNLSTGDTALSGGLGVGAGGSGGLQLCITRTFCY